MRVILSSLALSAVLIISGCERTIFDKQSVAPASLRNVAAIKLNFRFESDVPAPPAPGAAEVKKNDQLQADFDQNRAGDVLEKTIASPDGKRVIAVYRTAGDLETEYRLDMYSPDGKVIKKITPPGLAVHFPDTIMWAPDSTTVAFVGMMRARSVQDAAEIAKPLDQEITDTGNTNSAPAATDTNSANSNVNNAATQPASTDQGGSVLTFRTEQIYSCGSDGGDLKPLTQQEGLIYFYFDWAPDSSALVALATTWREWQFGENQTRLKGEVYIPAGRPRIVEKNGRERRLDDSLTAVHPVWSPDSAKIAAAFDTDVRVFDAIGDVPTGAAIPLRNPLMISSKAFDDEMEKQISANSNANGQNAAKPEQPANAVPAATQDPLTSTLPDPNSLVSFNPIVELKWTEDKMLYLQTGYIKEMKDGANSARSYMRWHRLMFSPQATKLN
jgi:hypothetical protein